MARDWRWPRRPVAAAVVVAAAPAPQPPPPVPLPAPEEIAPIVFAVFLLVGFCFVYCFNPPSPPRPPPAPELTLPPIGVLLSCGWPNMLVATIERQCTELVAVLRPLYERGEHQLSCVVCGPDSDGAVQVLRARAHAVGVVAVFDTEPEVGCSWTAKGRTRDMLCVHHTITLQDSARFAVVEYRCPSSSTASADLHPPATPTLVRRPG